MNKLDFYLSPEFVRSSSLKVLEMTTKGQGLWNYHPEKLDEVVDYVHAVILEKYPRLNIPFHSRWGHFRVGGVDRQTWLKDKMSHLSPIEQAKVEFDLVIPSVLLDAGAGSEWSYYEKETNKHYNRSEGLGVASFHLFYSGKCKSNATELSQVTNSLINDAFQVTETNPLIGVEGRTTLLKNLGFALKNKTYFKDERPGNLVDYLIDQFGQTIPASAVLKSVLLSLGPIWPGRLNYENINLGDVWKHSKLGMIGFHKLSQWMTYSLLESLMNAGLNITGVNELTGLAEYRNGGLMIDSGLIEAKNLEHLKASWKPEDDFLIEWRSLTVALLDLIGERIQKKLEKSPEEFPLAKVLEGGTWWAGRKIAAEKRIGGTPPLNIVSDGTVF